MSTRSVILAFVAAAAFGAGAGCEPTEIRGTAYYDAPAMDYVGPDVQVVADVDYPVFYSDNYYWRYYDGGWYRSPVYNGGWISVSNVPYAVRRIDRPWNYSNYHVRRDGYYRPAPGYRGNTVYRGAPVYRGGPGYRGAPAPVYRGAPAPRPVPRGERVPVRTFDRDHRR